MGLFTTYIKKVKRPGIKNLFAFLRTNGYFSCPSSRKNHGVEEGGNLKHSLAVTEKLLQLREVLAPEIGEDSCIICGLFHDLGKASYYNKPLYIKLGEEYIHNPDRLPIPHQVASLEMLGRFIPLTEEEAYAILYHNGLYTPDGTAIIGRETKLLMLLHWADMWVSHFTEKEPGGKLL